MKVLLVEDDVDVRESCAELLQLSGFDVHSAEHGRAALDLLHAGYLPDVVLLDLMMPVLNGVELLRIIRGDPRFAGSRAIGPLGARSASVLRFVVRRPSGRRVAYTMRRVPGTGWHIDEFIELRSAAGSRDLPS